VSFFIVERASLDPLRAVTAARLEPFLHNPDPRSCGCVQIITRTVPDTR
jgi:hypothetical protein